MAVTGNTQLGATKQELIAALVQKELKFQAKLVGTVTDVSPFAVKGSKFREQAQDFLLILCYLEKLIWPPSRGVRTITGKTIEQVEKDCDRDNFMSSEEAKTYGIVDHVVQSRKEIPGGMEKPVSLT